MTAKQLTDSILQMAIQGKLVLQDPNDEPASALLERIRKEKRRLVTEGKLKKRDLEENTIDEDDVPFVIPKGWVTASLKALSLDSADGPFGSNLKKDHYTDKKEVRIIQLSNIGETGWKDSNVKYTTYEHLETIKRSEAYPGDIIIAKMMPAGRAIICPDCDNKFVLSSDAVRFNFSNILYKKYLYYAINSSIFRNQVYGNVQGITRVRTSLTKLRDYYLPIPPIKEQYRIVDRIEEILPIITEYGDAYEEATKMDAELPDKLKKSILQEAIMGKLGTQDQNDEPASALLEKIRAEKHRLVKKGRLKKKDLEETPISEDEIPFKIPESWEWCRLGDVADIARGGSPRPIREFLTDASNGLNWIKIGDTDKGGKYINSCKEKIKPEGLKKTRMVHPGDFLLTNSMSFGRPYITNIEGCIHDGWLMISPYAGVFDQSFLFYLLSSAFAHKQFSDKVAGAVVQNLNSDKVADTFVPIPPLAEQHRIVQKIEELYAEIDNMTIENNININETEETEKD